MADLVIRLEKESVEGIPKSLLHYAADHDFNQVFYYARNSDYTEKSLQLLADADTLSAFCGGRYNDWKEAGGWPHMRMGQWISPSCRTLRIRKRHSTPRQGRNTGAMSQIWKNPLGRTVPSLQTISLNRTLTATAVFWPTRLPKWIGRKNR